MNAGRIVEREELRERTRVFRDRAHAGEVLGAMLAAATPPLGQAVVLAIPAGGVPVAAPLAAHLGLPIDIAVVSKITPPWNTEVGYGAVAFDGSVLLNEGLVRQLGLSETQIEDGIARTRAKVARRAAELRPGAALEPAGAAVILVDDGLASGFTMRAALTALRAAGAARLIVAVPTAHTSAARAVAALADVLYCANLRSGPRYAVADAYVNWYDVGEDEVRALLARAAAPPA